MNKIAIVTATTAAVFLLLFFFHPAAVLAGAAVEPRVLATIDGRPLTSTDFAHYLELFNGDPRFRPETPAARKKLLEHLIDRTILLEYAREKGYDRRETLKKHGSLNPQEKETIILRQLLTEEISSRVQVDEKAIADYRRQHPQLTELQAREQWTSERQQELFRALMARLRRRHVIVIH